LCELAGHKLLHNVWCGGDFHSSILITTDAYVLSVTEEPPKHDVFPDVGVDPDDFSDRSPDATTDSMCSSCYCYCHQISCAWFAVSGIFYVEFSFLWVF